MDYQEEYKEKLPFYERAIEKVTPAIEKFLLDNEVAYLNISKRVKTFDSFIKKVDVKQYSDPFKQNEDFCGIRIIVFYPNDIDAVESIITDEFELQNIIYKSEELGVKEFGYRSRHYIVKIKKEWLSAPDYRGLDEVKIEVQVRTILMHAWAEIEHKLRYKNDNQVPKPLQRQLYLLSASLEAADNQFQIIKENVEKYREEVKKVVQDQTVEKDDLQLNFDSLSVLMEVCLPDYRDSEIDTAILIHRLTNDKISIDDIFELLINAQEIAKIISSIVNPSLSGGTLSRAGIVGYLVEVKFGQKSNLISEKNEIIEEIKRKLTEQAIL